MDYGISSNISRFADDTKTERQISSDREALVVQSKLNRMHEWAVKWQMDFNIKKCSTLNVGRHNHHHHLNEVINKLSKKIYGTRMYVNRLKDNFIKINRITVIQSLNISIIN